MHKWNTDQDFTKNMIETGYGEFFDYYGIHGYEDWPVPERNVGFVRNKYPDKGVWQTESGFWNFKEQLKPFKNEWSKYIKRAFEFFDNDVEIYTFFIMSCYPGNLTLLTQNGTPKTTLAAICTIAGLLNGMKNLKHKQVDNIDIYTFKNYKGYGAAILGTGTIKIKSKGEVTAIDEFGFEKVLPKKGIIDFELPENTCYLLSKTKIEVIK